MVPVNETKVTVEYREVYVWQPSMWTPSKLFTTRCRGQPVIVVDRGPGTIGRWMTATCRVIHAGKRGERSVMEAWSGLFKYRTSYVYSRLLHYGS